MSDFDRLRKINLERDLDPSKIENSSLRKILGIVRKDRNYIFSSSKKGHSDHTDHNDNTSYFHGTGSDEKSVHLDHTNHSDHTDHTDHYKEKHTDRSYSEGFHHTDSANRGHTDITESEHVDS